jgi:hypothetical protein
VIWQTALVGVGALFLCVAIALTVHYATYHGQHGKPREAQPRHEAGPPSRFPGLFEDEE